MAVREFDGTDDVIDLDDGGLGAFANSDWSIVILGKPTSIAGPECFFTAIASSNTLLAIYDNAGGSVANGNSFDSDVSMSVGLSASAWQIFGVDMASGSATPRGHRKVLGSGSFTHANASGTQNNHSDVLTSFRVGQFRDGTGEKDFRVAVIAAFDTQLSDADWVTIESTASTLGLIGLGAVAVWEFNQANTATPVTDLVGSADQTAITGTTVINDDDPAWTFGLSTPQELRPDADTTTTGWTETPLWSKVNDESDATIIQATLS